MTKNEIIKNWIENEASDDELVQIVNEVNSYDGSLEDMCYYEMYMLDEFFCEMKPTEFLQKLARDFDNCAEGFKFTIYGIESTCMEDVVEEIKGYAEDVANAIENNLGNIYLPSSLEEALEEE